MSDELKMTLWRSPLPQSENTPESWQIYKRADFWVHSSSLLRRRIDEVAAKKNSTLANLMSLDHSWSHTCRIIIICRTRKFIKLCYIYKKQRVIFPSIYPSGFQSLATSNPLFRRESSLPLKKESQRGVVQCMVTFPEENFPSVFVPTL